MEANIPKVREFLSWVRELHGEKVSKRCREVLQNRQEDDFVPLVVLNDVLAEFHKGELEALQAQIDRPFDSDD